jgi:hypothetical protein
METQFRNTSELTVHPALAGFPDLTRPQYESLCQSIHSEGILTPLIVDTYGQVYDGRHRLRAALDLRLERVPVVIRPITPEQVISYAIESAVVGRNLSVGAIAFILFEKHPEIVKQRGKTGRKKGSSRGEKEIAQNCAISEDDETMSQLADHYRIDRRYFSWLAKMQEESSPEEWDVIRQKIVVDEIPISSLYRGWGYTHSISGQEHRRSEPTYAALTDKGRPSGLIFKSFTTLSQGFRRWEHIPLQAKAAVEKEWSELLTTVPDELLDKVVQARKARKI